MKKSSSDSRRGDTDSTRAPAGQRRPQEAVHVGSLAQLDRRAPRRSARTRAPSGSAGSPRRAPRRSTTSVDSRRADSSSSSGPTLRVRPANTIATRSQVISTSGRMCVE